MPSLKRSAIALASLLVLAGACSGAFWRSEDGQVTTTVSLPADSALRVAATQLQHHGFRVYQVGDRELITEPRAVPEHARQSGEGEQWIIRVGVEPLSFVRGSRVRVTGFTVPQETTVRPVSDNQVRENAVLVTGDRNPRLYREVEAVAGWINDAAGRRGE